MVRSGDFSMEGADDIKRWRGTSTPGVVCLSPPDQHYLSSSCHLVVIAGSTLGHTRGFIEVQRFQVMEIRKLFGDEYSVWFYVDMILKYWHLQFYLWIVLTSVQRKKQSWLGHSFIDSNCRKYKREFLGKRVLYFLTHPPVPGVLIQIMHHGET